MTIVSQPIQGDYSHVGIQVETNDGVTYINGYPENGHLILIIGPEYPPQLPTLRPSSKNIPIKPGDAQKIIQNANRCKARLKVDPLKYSRVLIGFFGQDGFTSNQVPISLLKSIGSKYDVKGELLKQGIDAPYSDKALPPSYIPQLAKMIEASVRNYYEGSRLSSSLCCFGFRWYHSGAGRFSHLYNLSNSS